MSLTDKQKEMLSSFLDKREDLKKKIDEHLEKVYIKKENSLTKDIKNKTRQFKEILLKSFMLKIDYGNGSFLRLFLKM